MLASPLLFLSDYIGPKLTGVTVTQSKEDVSKVKLTLAGSNFCKGPSCGKIWLEPCTSGFATCSPKIELTPLPSNSIDCILNDPTDTDKACKGGPNTGDECTSNGQCPSGECLGRFAREHDTCWSHTFIEVLSSHKIGRLWVDVGGTLSEPTAGVEFRKPVRTSHTAEHRLMITTTKAPRCTATATATATAWIPHSPLSAPQSHT